MINNHVTLSNVYNSVEARPKSFIIDAMCDDDWEAVKTIYLEGIATGHATFETAAPEWEAWNSGHRPDCRFVARRDGEVIGWTALSPVSKRSVFSGVAEVSIYVAAAERRHSVGRSLLLTLIEASEVAGIWTLQAGIFAENEASVSLHLACGFHIVGRRERLGRHYGVWRDALLLERRSSWVGVEGT